MPIRVRQPRNSSGTPRLLGGGVLKSLWDCKGPSELLNSMATDYDVRHQSRADELESQAGETERINRAAAGRLRRIAETHRRINGSARQFARVDGFEALALWYQSEPMSVHPMMTPFLNAFAGDPENGSAAPGIARGLELLERAQTALALRPSGSEPSDIMSLYDREPVLSDPEFHSLLASIASRFQASGLTDQAARLRKQTESVRAMANLWADVRRAKGAKKGTRIAIRVPPGEAESWFLALPRRFSDLSRDVRKGTVPFVVGVRKFDAAAGADAPYLRNAFFEHVLAGERPELAREVLRAYCRSAQNTPPGPVYGRRHATDVLHYAMAVLEHWRELPDARMQLKGAVDMVSEALLGFSHADGPRLARDLVFTRGRLLENLGEWDAVCLAQAEADYEQGLDLKGAEYECSARGRAFGDLANTVSRTRSRSDKAIDGLFEDALGCLPSDSSHYERAVVLMNYAVFLNERNDLEPALCQERALGHIDDAIAVLQGGHSAKLGRTQVAQACAHLTRGNIIRSRFYGDARRRLEASLDSYEEALRCLGDRECPPRGAVLLNKAHAYASLAGMAKDPGYLARAKLAADEAVTLLSDSPTHHGEGLVARAQILARIGGASELRDALDDATQGLLLLESTGRPLRVANASRTLGMVLLDACDYASSAAAFERAAKLYVDKSADVDAIVVLLKAADARMRGFKADGDTGVLQICVRDLECAGDIVERLWERSHSLEWRWEVSFLADEVYSDLAFCRAKQGARGDDVLALATKAKPRELASALEAVAERAMQGAGNPGRAEFLESLHSRVFAAERLRFDAQRGADHLASIAAVATAVDETLDEIEETRELAGVGGNKRSVDQALRLALELVAERPHVAIVDVTVSRWGTVLTVVSHGSVQVACSDMSRPELYDRMLGRVGGSWSESYSVAFEPGPFKVERRQAWAESTRRLLEFVGEGLSAPLLRLGSVADRDVILIPGVLAGMPIHAATTVAQAPACLLDAVRSVSYTPSLSALRGPPSALKVRRPQNAVVVLSDVGIGRARLDAAPQEVAGICGRLAWGNCGVKLLAVAGKHRGRAVFASAGQTLDGAINVLEAVPSPDAVLDLIPGSDLFVYSGHSSARSGLLLQDEQGAEVFLGFERLAGNRALGAEAMVHLSSCESAREEPGLTADGVSVGAAMLRAGASVVAGTAWNVMDLVAQRFSECFYTYLLDGTRSVAEAHTEAVRLVRSDLANGRLRAPTGFDRADAVLWAPFVLSTV